mmetsp:Transcript_53857/g.156512  ORF Transcript_53857/g.156512 Transcript_53857/m.156512 type:complete len:239 (-) Transcript_53857:1044-1760(-)
MPPAPAAATLEVPLAGAPRPATPHVCRQQLAGLGHVVQQLLLQLPVLLHAVAVRHALVGALGRYNPLEVLGGRPHGVLQLLRSQDPIRDRVAIARDVVVRHSPLHVDSLREEPDLSMEQPGPVEVALRQLLMVVDRHAHVAAHDGHESAGHGKLLPCAPRQVDHHGLDPEHLRQQPGAIGAAHPVEDALPVQHERPEGGRQGVGHVLLRPDDPLPEGQRVENEHLRTCGESEEDARLV